MHSIKPRAAAEALPSYRPGRAAQQAMNYHGLASAVRLASNELSLDPLPWVGSALNRGITDLNRYPDHRASELRAELADLPELDGTAIVPALEAEWALPIHDGAWTVDTWIGRLDLIEVRPRRLSLRPRRTGLTEPDPGTHERWNDGTEWAHMAEFGPYRRQQ